MFMYGYKIYYLGIKYFLQFKHSLFNINFGQTETVILPFPKISRKISLGYELI